MANNVINMPVCHGLLRARYAASRLAALGVTVYAAKVSGSAVPLLYVSTLPAGIEFAQRGRYPDGRGGIVLIHAALFEGCRLEWTVVRPARATDAKVVGNG